MITKTVTAVYDGETLRPDTPLELEPNARYRVIIEVEPVREPVGNAWEVLARYAGTVEAPADWSLEHDHYLYGTPKRYSGPTTDG